MVNSQDITPEYVQSKYILKELGILKTEILPLWKFKMKIDLNKIWQYSANLNAFSKEITKINKEKVFPGNISALCIYGSVLYKNLPKTKFKKTWFGFGTKRIAVVRPIKEPNDLDLMVLTKEPVGEELFFPGKENIVKTSILESDGFLGGGYGSQEVRGNLKLHLTYRSEEQFLNTLQNGDVLSEAVVRYGLPLVGENNFERTISGISSPKRNPLHEIIWKDSGKLNGKIIELTNSKTSSKSKEKPEEIETQPVEINFINPWGVEIPKLGKND